MPPVEVTVWKHLVYCIIPWKKNKSKCSCGITAGPGPSTRPTGPGRRSGPSWLPLCIEPIWLTSASKRSQPCASASSVETLSCQKSLNNIERLVQGLWSFPNWGRMWGRLTLGVLAGGGELWADVCGLWAFRIIPANMCLCQDQMKGQFLRNYLMYFRMC